MMRVSAVLAMVLILGALLVAALSLRATGASAEDRSALVSVEPSESDGSQLSGIRRFPISRPQELIRDAESASRAGEFLKCWSLDWQGLDKLSPSGTLIEKMQIVGFPIDGPYYHRHRSCFDSSDLEGSVAAICASSLYNPKQVEFNEAQTHQIQDVIRRADPKILAAEHLLYLAERDVARAEFAREPSRFGAWDSRSKSQAPIVKNPLVKIKYFEFSGEGQGRGAFIWYYPGRSLARDEALANACSEVGLAELELLAIVKSF